MQEEYLLLGYITDAFSLDGTFKVLSKTDFAETRYQEGKDIYLCSPRTKERQVMTVESYRGNGQFDFVKVKEVNSKEEALAFKGYEIRALKDYDSLAKDEYYFVDLVGCKVLNEKLEELGTVTQVEEFPAQLTLRVKRAGKEDFFVPFVKAFIRRVDINKKEIEINVIGGML
ncbi:MAG: 16S rRNA processing protein RimM [Bacilli bacterium]|nr:16S rRNA processing protein RimM [Bacilli bacterium]